MGDPKSPERYRKSQSCLATESNTRRTGPGPHTHTQHAHDMHTTHHNMHRTCTRAVIWAGPRRCAPTQKASLTTVCCPFLSANQSPMLKHADTYTRGSSDSVHGRDACTPACCTHLGEVAHEVVVFLGVDDARQHPPAHATHAPHTHTQTSRACTAT